MVFDFAGDFNYAMGVLLAYTGRVGIFGISLTVWIVTVISIEWGVDLIQSAIRHLVPGATFEQVQVSQAEDYIEFNDERDHAYDDTNLTDYEDHMPSWDSEPVDESSYTMSDPQSYS